jgi:hypothetical protein
MHSSTAIINSAPNDRAIDCKRPLNLFYRARIAGVLQNTGEELLHLLTRITFRHSEGSHSKRSPDERSDIRVCKFIRDLRDKFARLVILYSLSNYGVAILAVLLLRVVSPYLGLGQHQTHLITYCWTFVIAFVTGPFGLAIAAHEFGPQCRDGFRVACNHPFTLDLSCPINNADRCQLQRYV